MSAAAAVAENQPLATSQLSHCEAGLELADALHHASYRDCDSRASFDDKHFARRARRMGLAPQVVVPG